jgi:hypothetical protein
MHASRHSHCLSCENQKARSITPMVTRKMTVLNRSLIQLEKPTLASVRGAVIERLYPIDAHCG